MLAVGVLLKMYDFISASVGTDRGVVGLWDGEVKAVGGKFVVLFLSEEVKAVGGKFIVLLSGGEEPLFSVLLSSAIQGEERPLVLAREEVNKREWEEVGLGALSSWLLVPFHAMMGSIGVEGVLPLRSM